MEKKEEVPNEDNNDLESPSDTEETENQEDSEPLPPYNEVAPVKPKKKRRVPVLSVFMLLLVMAAVAAGYFFYKKQEMTNQQLQSRIAGLEAKINGMGSDQEARKALKREFMVFQGDTAENLKKQERDVRTVVGEIGTLREAMEQLASAREVDIPEQSEEMDEVAEEMESVEEEEIAEHEPASHKSVKRSKETQEYIDLVESTFEKFVRLVKEGSSKLWDYFAGLIEQYTKA